MKFIIKDEIKHQGIGGEEFIVDEGITKTLTNNKVISLSETGNWACYNFIHRRRDFNKNFPYKLYYGKVNGFGYILAEDEFKKGE